MRLRKKDFEVPKNFFVPPWEFTDSHRGSPKSLRGELGELAIYDMLTGVSSTVEAIQAVFITVWLSCSIWEKKKCYGRWPDFLLKHISQSDMGMGIFEESE